MQWSFIMVAGVVCGLFGCALTYIVCQRKLSHAGSDSDRRAVDAEARLAELRTQIGEAGRDFDDLRKKLSDAESARAVAETRAIETEKALTEQRALLEDAKAKLVDTFKALAADALAGNNMGFLALAEEKFKALKDESKSDLDARKTAIEGLLKPISDTLTSYQKESKDLEERRLKEIGTVGEQLRSLAVAQTSLQSETAKLVNALKSPQVRGRWGEIASRRQLSWPECPSTATL